MKTLVMEIEEKTLNQLRTALMVRGMAGTTAGLIEAFALKIVTALDDGLPTVTLALKKDPT